MELEEKAMKGEGFIWQTFYNDCQRLSDAIVLMDRKEGRVTLQAPIFSAVVSARALAMHSMDLHGGPYLGIHEADAGHESTLYVHKCVEG